MKRKPKPTDEQTVMRTFTVELLTREGKFAAATLAKLKDISISTGVAVQQALTRLGDCLKTESDEHGLICADLIFPISTDQLGAALKLVSQPRAIAPMDKGPKAAATPQYRNTYRFEEVIETNGTPCRLRARIAERFSYQVTQADKVFHKRALSAIDIKIGLQRLITSWLRPVMANVPRLLFDGIAQEAAQQLMSNLGLLSSDHPSVNKVSFPSLADRDPQLRFEAWRRALRTVANHLGPFAYASAREVCPGQYAANDRRGNRMINVDPVWKEVQSQPEAPLLPIRFLQSSQVVVYERRHRLYAALPLLNGGDDQRLFWWRKYYKEFEAVAFWQDHKLKDKENVMLVPLTCNPAGRRPTRTRRLIAALSDPKRKVNWSSAVPVRRRRNGKWCQSWELHLVTSQVVKPILRPNVIGFHFGLYPIVWWAVADQRGAIITEGRLDGNDVLDTALRRKAALEKVQAGGRWIKGKTYGRELQRQTRLVISEMVRLAEVHDANIAVEEVRLVDKRTGKPKTNLTKSHWNYGTLPAQVEWWAKEKPPGGTPIPTIAKVSDFQPRHTCPTCGACRKSGQKKDKADTYWEKGTFHCRKCAFIGEMPHDHQARIITRLGLARLLVSK